MLTEFDLLLGDEISEKSKTAHNPAHAVKPRLSKKAIRLFAQTLARLLQGGVPLIAALEVLERESKNKTFRPFLNRLKNQLREGHSLSASLAEASLPVYFTQMLEAGELSGNVPEILTLLAQHMLIEEERKRKVLEAIVYPGFVLSLGILSFFILLQFVIPKITQVYRDFEGELPSLTQAIIALSHWAIPLFIFFILFAGFILYALKKQRDWIMPLFLKLPYLKSLFHKSFLIQLSAVFALLLKSGIPMLKTLDSIMNTFSLNAQKKHFEEIKSQISEGMSLTEALNRLDWIGESERALIRSGEEAGKLPEAFEAIQRETQNELESQISFGLKVLEPVLIVVVGLAIGFIVVGAILPILEMSELLN